MCAPHDTDRCAENKSNGNDVSGEEIRSVMSCSAQEIAEELTRLDAVSVSHCDSSPCIVSAHYTGEVIRTGHLKPKDPESAII